MRARSSNATHTHVYAYTRVLVHAYAHARIRYRVNWLVFYNVLCLFSPIYCLYCECWEYQLTLVIPTFKIGIVKRDTAHGQRGTAARAPRLATHTHDTRSALYSNIGCGKKQSLDGAFHTVKSRFQYRAGTVQGNFRNLKNQ